MDYIHIQEGIIEINLDNKTQNIDWSKIFENNNPLKVEIGPGKGNFLIRLAKQEPKYNYIGIEIRNKRVNKINSKITREKLNNIKIIKGDARELLPVIFENNSVHTFFIHFPDPWPKRRHQKRRIITFEFIEILGKILIKEGYIYLTTDVQEYSQIILDTFQKVSEKIKFEKIYYYTSKELELSQKENFKDYYHKTIHEEKFKIQGRIIHYFCFQKI